MLDSGFTPSGASSAATCGSRDRVMDVRHGPCRCVTVDANQQEIAVADQPHRAVWKRGGECVNDRAEIVRRELVSVRPLTEDSSCRQPLACGMKKLAM